MASVSEEEIRAVERAIARLPSRTLDAFMMHRFDNLSYEQIAIRLGITQKAVERHMVKALVVIRKARERFAQKQRG